MLFKILESELDKLVDAILNSTTSPREIEGEENQSRSRPNSARSRGRLSTSTESYSVTMPKRRLSGGSASKSPRSSNSQSPRSVAPDSPRLTLSTGFSPTEEDAVVSEEVDSPTEELVKLVSVGGIPATRAGSYYFSWGGHYTGCWVNGRVCW